MARSEDTKAFCVLEFAKTEPIVTVQRRFRTKYHIKSPTDKTIRERYKQFQQSVCLCTARRTGRPRLSSVCESSGVDISREPGNADASVKCLAHSAQTSILTSLLSSMLIFPVVGFSALLTITLLFFPGLHGHLT
jgi:hypothetical protein